MCCMPKNTAPDAASLTDAAIRVEGLVKAFKELEVLRGVDFEVERGSIFALLGSNGAGKTTVIRILATLLRADAGTAAVHGFDVADRAGEVRESISLTGQFAAVDEILTGRENLVLVARLRHLPDAGRIADDAAGSLLAHRRGLAPGGHLLRWHAPPAGHRDEPDRRPAGGVPRRADHGPGPGGAPGGVGGDPGPGHAGARRCC